MTDQRVGIVHPLTIGNVTIANNLILAPMAGVTDQPYRVICHEQGAGLVCMEMVSAKAIYYNNKNTAEMMETDPAERPVSLQLFGSDPECISEMAKRIEHLPWDILDINMGCPVPKVVNNGDGSALMKNPRLAGEIIERTAKAIKKPVTVKFRKGFDDAHVNAVEMAHVAEESGAAAVAIHGRTREQYYSGQADWDIIAQVKQAVRIPVIGNGDIRGYEDAARMYEQTGCDAFMIGRAVQGNPWIFREILEADAYYAAGATEGTYVTRRPDNTELVAMILRHARDQIACKGEHIGMLEMRKHAAWYTAGFPGASKLREKCNEISDYEALERLLTLTLL